METVAPLEWRKLRNWVANWEAWVVPTCITMVEEWGGGARSQVIGDLHPLQHIIVIARPVTVSAKHVINLRQMNNHCHMWTLKPHNTIHFRVALKVLCNVNRCAHTSPSDGCSSWASTWKTQPLLCTYARHFMHPHFCMMCTKHGDIRLRHKHTNIFVFWTLYFSKY